MSLLIMSGVLITGASLGTISVLSLRQGRAVDDSIAAFAAAESGAEQTLYQIRRVGTSVATLNLFPNHDSTGNVSGPAMTNGAKWSRDISASESTLFTSIQKEKVYEVVLWNPDDPANDLNVKSLNFTWDDNCGGLSGLEVQATGWDPSIPEGSLGFNPTVGFHGSSPALTFLHDSGGVVDNGFNDSLAYRVRLRAKICDISNLGITARDVSNAVVNIPSRIAITSTGEFVTARQAMEVRLPRLQPLSGAFDFVIFSQCSILKGITAACP